jgi:hypothetical protein
VLSSYSPRFGVPAPWTSSNITPRHMPVCSERIWDFRTVREAQNVEPSVDSTPTDSSNYEAVQEASEIRRLAGFDFDEELSDDDLANMPVYVRRTIQHGLIGNTFSEQSIPSPVPEHTSQFLGPEHRFVALRIADEVFDADDEDSDNDSDNTTTPVASSPQIYRFSTPGLSPSSSSPVPSLAGTSPSSPPAAPVFAP